MRSPRMRAIRSAGPPAGYGTTIVIGRVGKACASAKRAMAGNAAAVAPRCRKVRRESCIPSSSICSANMVIISLEVDLSYACVESHIAGDMVQMELRHLRYFVAVAEEGHVTRAAERLGMQQPPLSQQIQALERELAVQLFRRKPRGVELTDAGRALPDDARAIPGPVDHAFATTRRTARGEQGRIAIGFTSSAPFHPFVPRVIRAFREAYPLVALTLDEGGTTELIEDLRSERVDAAFIRTPVADPMGVAINPLLEEAMLVALPATHALAADATDLPLAALAAETFIVYRRP